MVIMAIIVSCYIMDVAIDHNAVSYFQWDCDLVLIVDAQHCAGVLSGLLDDLSFSIVNFSYSW